MTTRLSLAVALTGVIWLASCASSGPVESLGAQPEHSDARLSQASFMIETLATLRTPEEMGAFLKDGLQESEISRVGFDQVTIAECVDRVVSSALEDRSSRGAPQARKQLTESLEAYFAAVREAMVRRSAGAAPCLPYMR
jgi:hypothetical protein